ncbi:MAG: alcohol dehydrogenase catalytic domain-containing protein [Anaerolineaceae bacterium]
MKAAFMDGPEHFFVKDIPVPELEENEVLIKVRACGICGSDLSLYKMGMEDRILGHEFSGDIVDTGAGVTGWKPGDRVVVEPSLVCWECYWCKHGQFHLCPSLGFTGIMADGGFAEYVKVPSYQLHHLPDEVSYVQGALVEPLSVSLHGVMTSIMRPGDTVAVFGCGIIGLTTLLWAKTLGADKVIATEVAETRIAAAKQLADVVLNPNEVDLSSEFEKLTDELGPRVIFECTGNAAVQADVINYVQRSGEIMLLGIGYEEIPLMLLTVILKGISIKGSQAYSSLKGSGEFPMTINFLKNRRINTEYIPLTQMPLDEIEKGFKALKNGECTKVIIVP